ncbi:MAG: hypothetical protein CVU42_04225 [Chloroflexi bacterium HGW-Chloroflexi-4]|jgi:hypothetical protein|nr:MAG: hypothetical protein CVU42_04225 [Chloroflexi bacterium HGW-Chloroflexi-4]
MLRKRIVVPSILMIIVLLLSGCNYQIQPTTPTVDPVALQATVDASVAQAVLATALAQTSTAAAMPTSTFTATATLEPTATETATATSTATATAAVVIPTATNTYVPTVAKPTATSTPLPYTCSLVSTSPSAGTKMSANADFDSSWKIKNTGSKDWQVGYVDLRYVSGTKMQTLADVFDVNVALARGAEHTIIIDMKAPGTAGKYTASFALVMEGITMCTLPVNIEVTP